MAMVADLAPGGDRLAHQALIRQIINYGVSPGAGDMGQLPTRGDAVVKLNTIAAGLNLPQIQNLGYGNTEWHPKINAIKNGLGLGADLDLLIDFAKNRYWEAGPQSLDSRLTNTASAGMVQKSDGSWELFATNTLKRTDLGLWTLPSRTNYVPNSAGNGGTATSSPTGWQVGLAGLSFQHSSGIDTDDLPYHDFRFYGTTTSAGPLTIRFMGSMDAATTVGTSLTHSVFARLMAGAFPGNQRVRVYETNTGGTTVNYDENVSITGTESRPRSSRVVQGADTVYASFGLAFGVTSGAAVDFTIRVKVPQQEGYLDASPPIITTGTSTIRQTDRVVQSITNSPRGFAVEVDLRCEDYSNSPRIVTWTDGTSANRYQLIITNAGSLQILKTAAGVSNGSSSLSNAYAGPGLYRLYGVVATGFMRIGCVGIGDGTAATSQTEALELNTRTFGSPGYTTSNANTACFKKYAEKLAPANDALFQQMKAIAQGWAA